MLTRVIVPRWALAASVAAVPVVSASSGHAEDEDTSLGAEYVDMSAEDVGRVAPKEEWQPVEEVHDEKATAGYIPGYRRSPAIGLSPLAPAQGSALPGGIAPSFGAPALPREGGYKFSGYLQSGIRAGVGSRDVAFQNQRKTTLHGDPVLPGASWGWWEHSMTVQGPWAHVAFTYGNDVVQATAAVGAWSVSESMSAAGYFQPPAQVGFYNAYLTYHPDIIDPFELQILTGAYTDRYGAMEKYSNGAYATALIGSVGGVGTTATLLVPFEWDIDVTLESGFKGDFNRAPVGIPPDPSNEHARPEEGSTYAGHAHLGATYDGMVTPTLHYIYAWSQDDRSDPIDIASTPINEAQGRADGSLDIIGADVRVDAKRFGYLYFGGARLTGKDSTSVSNVVSFVNSGSGKELNERFWGFDSNGTGDLTVIGGQYTLSLGTLLRYPMEFWGEGPDLIVSAFGWHGQANSTVEEFDDRKMLKYGGEVTYSFFSWLAASGRFDHLIPYVDDSKKSFAVLSPKLVFRSDWNTREALTLQYAYYVLGSDVEVNGDNRLFNAASDTPDRHLLSLFGTIWW